jgi:hypothetical protein
MYEETTKQKYKITSENLTNMRRQNAIFVKYVNVPTECVGSRNTFCRGNNNNNNNNNA